MTKDIIIVLVPLPISSIPLSNGDQIFFQSQEKSLLSDYVVHSPLNLVKDD